MIEMQLSRASQGAKLSTGFKVRVRSHMLSSRRRMRVYAKLIRSELESQFPGITFNRFEVVFTKHRAKLRIQPTAEGLAIFNSHRER